MTEYKTASELRIRLQDFFIPDGLENWCKEMFCDEKKEEYMNNYVGYENKFIEGEEVLVPMTYVKSKGAYAYLVDECGVHYMEKHTKVHKKPRFEFGEMILVSDDKTRDNAILGKFAGYRPCDNQILVGNHRTSTNVLNWKYAWKLNESDFVEVDGKKYYKQQILEKL